MLRTLVGWTIAPYVCTFELPSARWDIAVSAPWAAWGKAKDGQPAHHLVHHSMDVAAVFERLCTRHPVINARICKAAGRSLAEGELRWMAAFAFLHDVGKLSPAFQTKAWPDSHRQKSRSHLDEGWRWVAMTLHRRAAMGGAVHGLFAPLTRAGRGADERWLTALFAHHGRPTAPCGTGGFPVLAHYDWRAEEEMMGTALKAWFPGAHIEADVLGRVPLVHLFGGLLALSDWIGSDHTAFPLELELDLQNYAERARPGSRGAAACRPCRCAPSTVPTFGAVSGHAAPPEHRRSSMRCR